MTRALEAPATLLVGSQDVCTQFLLHNNYFKQCNSCMLCIFSIFYFPIINIVFCCPKMMVVQVHGQMHARGAFLQWHVFHMSLSIIFSCLNNLFCSQKSSSAFYSSNCLIQDHISNCGLSCVCFYQINLHVFIIIVFTD